jgi:hypothetical protein
MQRISVMKKKKPALFRLPMARGCLTIVGILALLFGLPIYASVSLAYTESKGPFKNWMQAVDWEGDGDLDVLVSHTRWEAVDISWAGVGIWVNQGDGMFELLRDRGTGGWIFGGFAAGAGDVDQDGDLDVFTQDFGINLLVNQDRLQEGERGNFVSSGGINSPPVYNEGYRDMGGTITLGDLNGDGRLDAFVAGCCYGVNARRPGSDGTHAPSVSWIWINDGRWINGKYLQMGYIVPLDFLDGHPIRQMAFGDLDSDGDLDAFAAVGQPTMRTTDSSDDLILLNDGTGWLALFNQQMGNTDSTSVTLGDVNGDGCLDALVGTSTGATLWMNQCRDTPGGEPIFVQAEESFEAVRTVKEKLGSGVSATADALFGLYLPLGSIRTTAVFLADLDGDGDLDALLARLWRAEIWWNDGQGEFLRSDKRFEYREDTGVTVADFDGDGDPDIFIGRNQDDYEVWFGEVGGIFTTTP